MLEISIFTVDLCDSVESMWQEEYSLCVRQVLLIKFRVANDGPLRLFVMVKDSSFRSAGRYFPWHSISKMFGRRLNNLECISAKDYQSQEKLNMYNGLFFALSMLMFYLVHFSRWRYLNVYRNNFVTKQPNVNNLIVLV